MRLDIQQWGKTGRMGYKASNAWFTGNARFADRNISDIELRDGDKVWWEREYNIRVVREADASA